MKCIFFTYRSYIYKFSLKLFWSQTSVTAYSNHARKFMKAEMPLLD